MHPIVIFDGIFFFFKSSKIRTWHDQRDVGHDGCVEPKVLEPAMNRLPVDFEAIFLIFFTFVLFLSVFFKPARRAGTAASPCGVVAKGSANENHLYPNFVHWR